MSYKIGIEDIVRQDKQATEAELVLVAKIDNIVEQVKRQVKHSRKYESLYVSRSNYRRKLKILRSTSENRLNREIGDDINVLEYHVFITGNEITKVRAQLSDAILKGQKTAGHKAYLSELERWHRSHVIKLTKLRKVLQ